MKKKILLLLSFVMIISLYGQTDPSGNPVFNSYQIEEIGLEKDFKLILNYYTLRNNIENPLSSVFISKEPTNDDIAKFATESMSYHFILIKNRNIVDLIGLNEKPKRELSVLNQKTGEIKMLQIGISGAISEDRAKEIIENKYSESAKIENGELHFNDKIYLIYTRQSLINEIVKVIEREKLLKNKVSEIMIPTKQQLEEYIIEETKKGKKLDFFTEIEGKEFDGIQIKPGVFTTLESIALYKWGRANYSVGVNTYEDAIEIFKKIKNRDLNTKEKNYIKDGFNKIWER